VLGEFYHFVNVFTFKVHLINFEVAEKIVGQFYSHLPEKFFCRYDEKTASGHGNRATTARYSSSMLAAVGTVTIW
jgi:hypothetical protein